MDEVKISELKSRFSKSHNSTEIEIAYSPQTLDFLMIILAVFLSFIFGLLIHRAIQSQRQERMYRDIDAAERNRGGETTRL